VHRPSQSRSGVPVASQWVRPARIHERTAGVGASECEGIRQFVPRFRRAGVAPSSVLAWSHGDCAGDPDEDYGGEHSRGEDAGQHDDLKSSGLQW